MTVLSICTYGDSVLRKKAKKVEKISDEIKKLVSDMIETMDDSNGVGLAANQVGVLHRLFVIRPVIKMPDGKEGLGDFEVYINPVISNPSKETNVCGEGCLSIPGIYLDIERPNSIHVEALDLDGNVVSVDLEGFKAREIMHENDHLNGVLFIDRAYEEDKEHIAKTLRDMKKSNKNRF